MALLLLICSLMNLYPIESGHFKLDGGAMFGVVPKSLWSRTNPADANNMIELATRCLLVEDANRLILIDNGFGQKQDEKFFKHYHLWGDHTLTKSLGQHGFHKDDITDVFLTHLHFDHCGGSVDWSKDRTHYVPAFKNAIYWSNKAHWDWATKPNAREKASFLTENIQPIADSGQLQYIENDHGVFVEKTPLGLGVFFADGHTEKQMLPHINYRGKTIVFMADLLPTAGHLPLPYVMGYDSRPLKTLKEKDFFLNLAADNGYYLWLEHDVHHPIITVKHTDKGVRLNQTFTIEEFFN